MTSKHAKAYQASERCSVALQYLIKTNSYRVDQTNKSAKTKHWPCNVAIRYPMLDPMDGLQGPCSRLVHIVTPFIFYRSVRHFKTLMKNVLA